MCLGDGISGETRKLTHECTVASYGRRRVLDPELEEVEGDADQDEQQVGDGRVGQEHAGVRVEGLGLVDDQHRQTVAHHPHHTHHTEDDRQQDTHPCGSGYDTEKGYLGGGGGGDGTSRGRETTWRRCGG